MDKKDISILIVDDEEIVLNAACRALRYEGLKIIKTTSPLEALEIMATNGPINLVLSDYRMPEMHGLHFLQEVRKKYPQTVRTMYSATLSDAEEEAKKYPGVYHMAFSKPFPEDFKEKIIKLARSSPQEIENPDKYQ